MVSMVCLSIMNNNSITSSYHLFPFSITFYPRLISPSPAPSYFLNLGISKDNHVVYIDRPCQIEPDDFIKKFSMEEYKLLHIQTMEWLTDLKARLSVKLGKRTYKHVVG